MESRRLRQLLLDTIGSAREREHEFLALFDDKPPPEPGLWTVKDHLAHLTAWRTNVEQLLDSVRTGTEAPKMDEDVQASNARVYSATKDLTADVVKSNALRRLTGWKLRSQLALMRTSSNHTRARYPRE